MWMSVQFYVWIRWLQIDRELFARISRIQFAAMSAEYNRGNTRKYRIAGGDIMGERIGCSKCGKKQKSLTQKKESGLCLHCYMEKYGEYPKSFMGNAPKSK